VNETRAYTNALAISKAFGSDAIQLAPAGEARFDPLSVTLLIASAILGSIGKGVCDGVQEWSKNKTLAGLDAIASSVSRLVKRDAPKAFTASPSRDELHKQIDESSRALDAARLKIGQAAPDAVHQVIEISVSATSTALEEMGLRSTASVRVGGALREVLSVTLPPRFPTA
jgi:hypothetical protein